MPVRIRKMTIYEFENFCRWSVEQQAAELMEEYRMFREEAVKKAGEEVMQMLPGGLRTPHHNLMTIEETDTGENVGFIWTIYEETDGRKQSFVCDFAIWETKRRKGYAAAALRMAEENAAESGCSESVLFVADRNGAARALYRKCGYQFLRPAGYGKYLVKQLY